MQHILIVENIFSGSDVIVALVVSVEVVTQVKHICIVETGCQACTPTEITGPVTAIY